MKHKIHCTWAGIEKAVHLSQTRYCGVSALLRKATPFGYRIEYAD